MEEKESDNDHQESDTDSDCDFDPIDYEKKKEENLRKVVLTEYHYHQVRQLLRDRRFEEVNVKKEQLRSQTCPEFLKKQKVILDEERKSRNESRSIFDLETLSMVTTMSARREYVNTEQLDNHFVTRQSLIDGIKEVLDEKTSVNYRVKQIIKTLACIEHEKESQIAKMNITDSKEYRFDDRRRAVVGEHDEDISTVLFTHGAAMDSPSASPSSASSNDKKQPKNVKRKSRKTPIKKRRKSKESVTSA